MDIKYKLDKTINCIEDLKNCTEILNEISRVCVNSIKSGGKIIFCGNGGSAADSQHLAAELVVKYKKVRNAIPAIALTTDTSILTAIGNDIGAESIFERQLEAIGKKGDVIIGISTSGNSKNIINTLNRAKKMGLKTIAFTGADGGAVKETADIVLRVPSNITNNIQEMHIICGHILCEIIEENI